MLSSAMPVPERVTSLEDAMVQLIAQVDRTSRGLAEFKDEMREFKDESERFRQESRKQWGELANKLGTMAEDPVAPSIGRILRETIGCPEDRIFYNFMRRSRSELLTTKTLLKAMAPAAIIGFNW